jgi:hypothetical protein
MASCPERTDDWRPPHRPPAPAARRLVSVVGKSGFGSRRCLSSFLSSFVEFYVLCHRSPTTAWTFSHDIASTASHVYTKFSARVPLDWESGSRLRKASRSPSGQEASCFQLPSIHALLVFRYGYIQDAYIYSFWTSRSRLHLLFLDIQISIIGIQSLLLLLHTAKRWIEGRSGIRICEYIYVLSSLLECLFLLYICLVCFFLLYIY